MFVVKVDKKVVAVTNNYDAAVSYVGGLPTRGRRVTITSLLPQDLAPAVQSLLRPEETGAEMPKAA